MTYEECKMQCMLLGYKLDVGDWHGIAVFVNSKKINIPRAFPEPTFMMCIQFHKNPQIPVDCYEDVINQLNKYIDMVDSL